MNEKRSLLHDDIVIAEELNRSPKRLNDIDDNFKNPSPAKLLNNDKLRQTPDKK